MPILRRYYFRIMSLPDLLPGADPVCVHMGVKSDPLSLAKFRDLLLEDYRWPYVDFPAGVGIWIFFDKSLGIEPDAAARKKWNQKAAFEVRQLVWAETSAML